MTIESESIVALYKRHADAWTEARLRESILYEKPWLDRFCALLPTAGTVPLYHASLDAAEYRRLLAAQGFAVVEQHRAEDQDCFGRTVWLAKLP